MERESFASDVAKEQTRRIENNFMCFRRFSIIADKSNISNLTGMVSEQLEISTASMHVHTPWLLTAYYMTKSILIV